MDGRHWVENKSTIKISNPVICMSGRIQLFHTTVSIEKIAQYFIWRQAIFSEIWSKIEHWIMPFNFKANIALVLSRTGLQFVDRQVGLDAL